MNKETLWNTDDYYFETHKILNFLSQAQNLQFHLHRSLTAFTSVLLIHSDANV